MSLVLNLFLNVLFFVLYLPLYQNINLDLKRKEQAPFCHKHVPIWINIVPSCRDYVQVINLFLSFALTSNIGSVLRGIEYSFPRWLYLMILIIALTTVSLMKQMKQ